MLKKKKLIAAIIAVIVLLAAVPCVTGFSFVPIAGRIIAQNKIAAYTESYYGKAGNVKMSFDWYNMSNYKGDGYLYNLRSDTIMDYARSDGARQQVEDDMANAARGLDFYTTVNDFSVTTYIDGSDHEEHYDSLVIYQLFNTGEVPPERLAEFGALAIETLITNMGHRYNFTGVSVHYYTKSGACIFSIPVLGKAEITLDALMDSAEVLDEDDYPLDYIQWLETNK